MVRVTRQGNVPTDPDYDERSCNFKCNRCAQYSTCDETTWEPPEDDEPYMRQFGYPLYP